MYTSNHLRLQNEETRKTNDKMKHPDQITYSNLFMNDMHRFKPYVSLVKRLIRTISKFVMIWILNWKKKKERRIMLLILLYYLVQVDQIVEWQQKRKLWIGMKCFQIIVDRKNEVIWFVQILHASWHRVKYCWNKWGQNRCLNLEVLLIYLQGTEW